MSLIKPTIRALSIIAFALSYRILTVSEELNRFVRRYFFLPRAKVHTQFNGIDFAEFRVSETAVEALKRDYRIAPTDTVIVNVGTFHPLKGQQYLIEAIGRHLKEAPIRCFCMGADTGSRDLCRSLVERFSLHDKVTILDYQENVPVWLRSATLYVQPTLNDAMPLVLLEAMHCGLPCVVSDHPSITSFVRDGITGLVTRRADPDSIAHALKQLMASAEVRATLIESGRRFVEEHCSLPAIGASLLSRFSR